MTAWVEEEEEEEVTRASLSTLESFLPSSMAGVSVATRVWSISPAMEREVRVT
jgi:hypothetical protein